VLRALLYNLMQQHIARETKRDSSAMKSISLLTMVFLPATAIAVSLSHLTWTVKWSPRKHGDPQVYGNHLYYDCDGSHWGDDDDEREGDDHEEDADDDQDGDEDE
jgi:hypothetical protein